MTIGVGQIYVEVGATYPFTYHFQNWLSEELTKRVPPSKEFIEAYGTDFDLMFNVSAKTKINVPEIKGPTVFKRTKDVEFSVFLPHDGRQPCKPDDCRQPIKFLLDSIVIVLSRLDLDASNVLKDAPFLLEHTVTAPEMIKIEDEALGGWTSGKL
jgi:hypothetical protein